MAMRTLGYNNVSVNGNGSTAYSGEKYLRAAEKLGVMDGVSIVSVPFQLRRYRLLGNEYCFTNTAQGGMVLLPVGNAHVYVIHQQTPSCLV